jgi:hypothetical protein
MACDACEVSAVLDGKRVHVKIRFDALDRLDWSDERNCFLYQCRRCLALWESCAYEKAATDISLAEARQRYPNARIREG